MKIENDYPKIKRRINRLLIIRKIILLLFLLSIIAVVTINLVVGGKLWMFYVLGAEALFYFAFLNYPLIDNFLIKRVTVVLFLACAYLYIIDLINKTKWSYFVIGIVAFSVIAIQLMFFFIGYKYQKRKIIPVFLTSVGATIYCILSILRVVKITWPIIVLGSLGLATLLMFFIFYYKIITNELKKYFNLK